MIGSDCIIFPSGVHPSVMAKEVRSQGINTAAGSPPSGQWSFQKRKNDFKCADTVKRLNLIEVIHGLHKLSILYLKLGIYQ